MGLFTLTECGENSSEQKENKASITVLHTEFMDLSIKPGDDFYHYANGNWLKNTPIPPEYSRYGAFEMVIEKNEKDLRELINEILEETDTPEGSIARKISDFYRSGMDPVKINESGISDIKHEIERINAISNKDGFENEIANFQKCGISTFFHVISEQDQQNSEQMIVYLWQAGLGLPDRDYYLLKDERTVEIREKYTEHVSNMFQLFGYEKENSDKNAKTILHIETQLAETSFSRLECRDPHKTYNKMLVSQLQEISPDMDWNHFFTQIEYPQAGEINVSQPSFFTGLSKIVQNTGIEDLKIFLHWKLMNKSAAYLTDEIVNENFEFYGKFLSGKKEKRPRWKRILSASNAVLGEAIGQLYVEKYFPPQAKQRMVKLTENLKKSLKSRIEQLTWMTDTTKQKALEKLATIRVKVGYPDKWLDYSDLEIKNDSYICNIFRAGRFSFAYEMNKAGKPVDPDEWHMTPQTVNAYYNPNSNEIVFPAAILQPPFFNMNADDPINYGAIGAVIGHEMTHGFDDQGRKYDSKGNLSGWWTENDATEFSKRATVLVDQFNHFTAVDSFTVDGQLTLGENIADLGGVTIAYNALQMALSESKNIEKTDGFTPEQRFFISYAQVWANNITEEELKRRIKEDVHSPGKFRVNGPVYNVEEFYKAFSVSKKDKMYIPPEKRVIIW